MRHTATTVSLLTLLAGVAAGCDAQGETVGFRGGTVVSQDGRFALEIPRGALDHEVEISIDQVECEVAVVGSCYEVHPLGLSFHKPATATFELGMDMNPERMALVVERESDWNKLADRTIDLEDDVLTASAMYLSAFAVVTLE